MAIGSTIAMTAVGLAPVGGGLAYDVVTEPSVGPWWDAAAPVLEVEQPVVVEMVEERPLREAFAGAIIAVSTVGAGILAATVIPNRRRR